MIIMDSPSAGLEIIGATFAFSTNMVLQDKPVAVSFCLIKAPIHLGSLILTKKSQFLLFNISLLRTH